MANFGGDNILRFSTGGALLNTITGGGLSGPAGLAFDPLGGLLVTSTNTNQVLRFNVGVGFSSFSFDRVFATSGLNRPIYILSPVPEPSSVVLFGLGLAGLSGLAVRKLRGRTV